MVSFYQLDYGCRVRILEGEYAGKEGVVVMGSRFGDVGINISESPKIGMYHVRTSPSALEIISLEDRHGIKKMASGKLSEFEAQKFLISLSHPEIVLNNPQYFSQMIVDRAKRNLEQNPQK